MVRYLIGIFLIVFGVVCAGADHLVFDRITVTPTDAEIISIYNPTSVPIDLSDYYITDSNNYYNLPSGSDFWSGNVSDFIARFPESQFIAPNESLILSLHTNQKFSDYYGYNSDLALFEDMRDAISGQTTISYGQPFSSLDLLNDNTEMLMLFKWEEGSDTVQDIDYFIWGNTSTGVDKTGVSGYVEDTDYYDQEILDEFPSTKTAWYSNQRRFISEAGDKIDLVSVFIPQGFDSQTVSLPKRGVDSLRTFVFAQHDDSHAPPIFVQMLV